ncbi:hypothetical protein D3C84_1119450 [compost metagenome]
MPKHFQLTANFFESSHPFGRFDNAIVNDAKPWRVDLFPDEDKPRQGEAQGDEASHSNGPFT